MTRQEFSQELKWCRTVSLITLKDLCFKCNMYEHDIYRIEKSLYNYGLNKALLYANAVNAEIIIKLRNGFIVVVNAVSDAVKVLKKARGTTSIYRVAKDTKFSTTGIANAENETTGLSIDMLLKLSEYYGMQVIVRRKE